MAARFIYFCPYHSRSAWMVAERREGQVCLGLAGGLAGTVVCFLIAIYIVQRRVAAPPPRRTYISAAVATNTTAYILAVVLAVLTAGVLLAIEVRYPIRLRRAGIATVVLFCVSLLITICVTHKRHKRVHWVFTGLLLVWMVVVSALWTESAWRRRAAVRVPMVVFAATLGLSAVGAAVVASLPKQGAWLAAAEWICVLLFVVLLVCSCAGGRRRCGRRAL